MITTHPNGIPPQVHEALVDVGSTSIWFKASQMGRFTPLFRDRPEVLEGIDPSGTKRAIAQEVFSRLARYPSYDELTTEVALRMCEWEPHEELKRQTNGAQLELQARAALKRLRKAVDRWLGSKRRASRPTPARPRTPATPGGTGPSPFITRFAALQTARSPQRRGVLFQELFHDMAEYENLEPRPAYKLDGEELDGSLSFNGSALPFEAKWWKDAIEREHGDILAAKLSRRGPGTRGIFVSVSGFSAGFKDHYRRGSNFITIDGQDLRDVLEGRITLRETLRHKLRHLDETGDCYRPSRDYLDGI